MDCRNLAQNGSERVQGDKEASGDRGVRMSRLEPWERPVGTSGSLWEEMGENGVRMGC